MLILCTAYWFLRKLKVKLLKAKESTCFSSKMKRTKWCWARSATEVRFIEKGIPRHRWSCISGMSVCVWERDRETKTETVTERDRERRGRENLWGLCHSRFHLDHQDPWRPPEYPVGSCEPLLLVFEDTGTF